MEHRGRRSDVPGWPGEERFPQGVRARFLFRRPARAHRPGACARRRRPRPVRRGQPPLKALIVGIACAAAFAGEAAAVEIEPSIQYWASEGKTTWNHNAKPANPAFGNPTSQLTYSGMKSGIVEMGLTVRIGEWFGTGTFGSGSIDGGTRRDEDWLAGQVKFSDTDSAIR